MFLSAQICFSVHKYIFQCTNIFFTSGDLLRLGPIGPREGTGIHAHQSLVGRSLEQIGLSMFRERGHRRGRHGMRRHPMRDRVGGSG